MPGIQSDSKVCQSEILTLLQLWQTYKTLSAPYSGTPHEALAPSWQSDLVKQTWH